MCVYVSIEMREKRSGQFCIRRLYACPHPFYYSIVGLTTTPQCKFVFFFSLYTFCDKNLM